MVQAAAKNNTIIHLQITTHTNGEFIYALEKNRPEIVIDIIMSYDSMFPAVYLL